MLVLSSAVLKTRSDEKLPLSIANICVAELFLLINVSKLIPTLALSPPLPYNCRIGPVPPLITDGSALILIFESFPYINIPLSAIKVSVLI